MAEDQSGALDGQVGASGGGQAGPKEWLLVAGNRIVVSAVALLGVFVVLVSASLVWPLEILDLLSETRAAQTLFNTLLSGTILLVSIVVSINSVVLSQELSSIGTQHERIEEAVGFRQSVEELSGKNTAPTAPSEFLQTMVTTLVELSEDLEATLGDDESDAPQEDLEAFARIVRDHTRHLEERLTGADLDSVDVLSAGLAYDYADEIKAGRQLSSVHRADLTDDQHAALEDLIEGLKQFAVAHEYFKSLFFKREFAKLSKTLLYVALPVIVFISYVMLAISAGLFVEFEVGQFSGVTLSMMAAYSVALAPYVVLTTFVLRSATIAGRSLATGTFAMSQQ